MHHNQHSGRTRRPLKQFSFRVFAIRAGQVDETSRTFLVRVGADEFYMAVLFSITLKMWGVVYKTLNTDSLMSCRVLVLR